MSHHRIVRRARKFVAFFLALGPTLIPLVLGAGFKANAATLSLQTDFPTLPIITQTYVIFASGPSSINQAIHESGSYIVIYDGGLYSGNGGRLNNFTFSGNPPPPVDVVPPCFGCTVSGTRPNYNAESLPVPILYAVNDFQPGGQYAQASGWFPGCVAPRWLRRLP